MNDASLRAALRLLVILDPSAAPGRDLAAIATQAAQGGATMFQVRSRTLTAADLAALTRSVMSAAGSVPVLVNDRLDVALASGAAGCHLGSGDFPLAAARAMVPAGFILGASAGNVAEAEAASRDGAHYLGIGPINATASKEDAGEPIGAAGFAAIARAGGLPSVAIGGVTVADVASLRNAGADGIAVIRAVLAAGDAAAAARILRQAFDR